jgi:hypothetical protein
MKRGTKVLGALPLFLAVAPLIVSQDFRSQPTAPSDILGPQLIAWSQLQKPQPVRQPDVPTPSIQQQLSLIPILTGTIVKDSGRFILKVSSISVYQLDDQEKAKRYEGIQVRVAGVLDAASNSFHIVRIELIS